ncbi:hypothetical protein RJ45_12845 [Photobacterium gaetbulicola]|uniref:Uncharacterized protein n=1 Tax=Photobacterium gaetbulicola TaxID=1295392 RepID=A0A0B9G3U0_9GAMM|nr:hypothetical protein [Photobacterium gaetbulicola]KHT63284.1 hypothetical protein RJ45_12845 [Photobacterium gaetbulicola]
MRFSALVVFISTVIFSGHALANDSQILLKSFHDYGIKKCDTFISQNTTLKGNWNFFINKHAGGIDGPVTEVTVVNIWGSRGDTVKTEDTYIQTPKNCYLRQTWTLTDPGSCSENIDGNHWYVSTKMPNKDYTTYKNSGGIELHAKEIQVGNFKVCVQEGSKRLSAKHG